MTMHSHSGTPRRGLTQTISPVAQSHRLTSFSTYNRCCYIAKCFTLIDTPWIRSHTIRIFKNILIWIIQFYSLLPTELHSSRLTSIIIVKAFVVTPLCRNPLCRNPLCRNPLMKCAKFCSFMYLRLFLLPNS